MSISSLADSLEGTLIRRGDPGYDDARSVYNAMITKRPAAIARCETVDDVAAAVRAARDESMEIAVRGGGHSGPGLGLVDDGLTIDLSGLKSIDVDPDARTVSVGGGCVWGEVDRATGEHGLATVSGIISSTGVGGLTLGGGHGYLTRQHGLTIDNLISAEIVLADGRVVQASEHREPELFWALRGGGGNFGVVTRFEFHLHPVGEVFGGPMLWPIEALEPTMRWYRDWLPRAPENVYAFYQVAEVPPAEPFPGRLHGQKVCGLVFCCNSTEKEATAALDEARKVGEPIFEHVGKIPYPKLQSVFDPLYPPGYRWYWKGDFVRELTDDAIAEHERFSHVPTPLSLMHMYPVDGLAQRVDSDATAWNHRDAVWSMVIAGVTNDPAQDDEVSTWARDYWQAVHPHSVGASYVNFMMDEGEDRIRATYGDNYDRLRKAKAKYDPDNVFHVNQNIEPA